MLYGCVKWSPRTCYYDTLRRAHHRFSTRCIGWRKHNRADHPISYLDTLVKTGSESIEATLRRRRIFSAGFVARMEDTRLPKCVMFGEMVGGAGCVGGQEKEGTGCFLDDLKASGIIADQWWTTTAQDEGKWRRTVEQGAERFIMAKWIAAEKTKAGVRHALVCPNVTGRTKERVAQSKRARAGSLALVDQPQVARTCCCALRAFGLQIRCHDNFLWCYVCFVLLRFRLFYAFVEAAALRSNVLQNAGVPIATRIFICFLEMSIFSSIFLYHCRFLFVRRVHCVFFPSVWFDRSTPVAQSAPHNLLTRWDVSSIPANGIFLTKN